jgi:simple sugar transport system permease protein
LFIARYREASIAAVAVLLVIYIQLNNSVFLSSPLMSVVLRDTARIGLIAMGIVLVMITGEIDLSVGATFAMAPYAMIRLTNDLGLSLWVTAPIAILFGIAVGFINGFITVKLRIPALITTLGTFFLLTGLTVSLANSQPIRMPVQQPFNLVFGQNRFGPRDSLFSWDGLTGFTPILWTLVVALILTLVLSRTVFGLHVISTGSNPLAAREIGVRTERVKIAAFMILGGLAALTGLITATISGSAAPDAGGSNLTLLAIAAAVIGGTALTGGSGTVIGALIGAFVISCLNNGLVLLGAQATQSNIFLGAAIIAAMILNVQLDTVRVRRRR